MGYCSLCSAPTKIAPYYDDQQWWLCDACYDLWLTSDLEALTLPSNQNLSVKHLRDGMRMRRLQIAEQIEPLTG